MYEGQQAQKANRKATAAARIQNDLQAARQRRDAIRQSRIMAANMQVKGVTQGVQNSSSVKGGQGSIQTQLNSNLSFLDQFNNLSDQASRALDSAAQHQGNASDWGKIADLSMAGFGNAPNITRAVFGNPGAANNSVAAGSSIGNRFIGG